MFRTLSLPRRLTATLAAGAVALGALAAGTSPANASDRDLLRFLAGAATIAIIAKAARDRDRGRAEAAPLPQPVRPGHQTRPGQHRPPQHAQVRLPAQCADRYRVRGQGVMTYYGERCLRRAGVDTRVLPNSCRQQVQTQSGPRLAYQGACLQQAGFRTARR